MLRVFIPYAISFFIALHGTVMADSSPVQEIAAEEVLNLGKRMYREGLLPDGQPIQSMVANDVQVDGRMFTCVNCHQRSGLGSIEGPVITWPINGKELFIPRRRTGAWRAATQNQGPGASQRWGLPSQYQAGNARAAYTEKSMARVLREGIAPDGRTLNRVMPRYDINDQDLKVLTSYLKGLSVNDSPGVDNTRIRFATVITDGVPKADRESMLLVLQSHIDIHNVQSRPHRRRAKSGPFYKTEQFTSYRLFELDVWELKGPRDTWRSQLDAYYLANPVFAMLGGISSGSWDPIHNFCEDREIPCIFPVTDQPVVSSNDWYSLYFSKGLYDEGKTAANYLQSSLNLKPNSEILQVYRTDSGGELLARGVRENIKDSSTIKLTELALNSDQPLTDKLITKYFSGEQPVSILLWLDDSDMHNVTDWLAKQTELKRPMFASWGLLKENITTIPDIFRDDFYFTYPRDLPSDSSRKLSVLKRWLNVRKIALSNLDIQAQMYSLGWIIPGAISHLRSEFFRDYFMESFDMMHDQDYAIPNFPRLTFGSGQRYAAKGCYIIQLAKGDQPELIQRSEWLTY